MPDSKQINQTGIQPGIMEPGSLRPPQGLLSLPDTLLSDIVQRLGQNPPRLHAVCKALRFNAAATSFIKKDIELDFMPWPRNRNTLVSEIAAWPRSVQHFNRVTIVCNIHDKEQRLDLLKLLNELPNNSRACGLMQAAVELDLRGFVAINKSGKAHKQLGTILHKLLRVFPRLSHIDLPDLTTGTVEPVMTQVSKHPTLTSLNINFWEDPAFSQATDAGLSHIGRISKLVNLECFVGVRGLLQSKQYQQQSRVLDLTALGSLKQLATLSLTLTACSGVRGIDVIATQCRSLRRLDINTNICGISHSGSSSTSFNATTTGQQGCWWPNLDQVTFREPATPAAVASWQLHRASNLRQVSIPQGFTLPRITADNVQPLAKDIGAICSKLATLSEPTRSLRLQGSHPDNGPQHTQDTSCIIQALSPLGGCLRDLQMTGPLVADHVAVGALTQALPNLHSLQVTMSDEHFLQALTEEVHRFSQLHTLSVFVSCFNSAVGQAVLQLCHSLQNLRCIPHQTGGPASTQSRGQEQPITIHVIASYAEDSALTDCLYEWNGKRQAALDSGRPALVKLSCTTLPDW